MILSQASPDSISITADFLVREKVCILPTDTVYGFSGIVPLTKDKIQRIKGRDDSKPFIQLVGSPEDVFLYTDAGIQETALLDNSVLQSLFSLWPGPLTIILPVVRGCSAGSTVAFRCPGDSWLRKVISLVGVPIYSTSVNRSGQAALTDREAIVEEFGSEVDLIVESTCLVGVGQPSTIVEVLPDFRCRVIRQGCVAIPSGLKE